MSPTAPKLNRLPSSYRPPRLDRRLLIVSNRLPITIKRNDEAKYELSMSSGGLVTAVSGLSKTTEFEWFGWPGLSVPEDEIERLSTQLRDEYKAIPVLMEESLADKHYNGFSNSVLWPLFHYHPSEVHFDESTWESYRAANRIFAREVSKKVESGDLIWVHDYHLMLLPQMLREEIGNSKENVKIGFFLHTPFPSSEIYRMLPVREEILKGVLHSDLIGFHTFDYARHFLSSCQKLLHLQTAPNCVRFKGNTVELGVFPVGIDPGKFHDKLEDPKIQERVSSLRKKFEGIKVLLGVDRLDYTKGLPQKLHALECLFEQHPETVGKVSLVQIAVPSREDVEDYQDLRAVVNETVGRINGRYGTIDYMPVHFVYRSVPFDELVALYALADGCLVTPTRDGMNLVCYEYIASQKATQGVMMLSEFAGAAESLDGCMLLNPWDVDAVGDIIYKALGMQEETRVANFQKLHRYIEKHTSELWGRSFVRGLSSTAEQAETGA